MQATVAVMTPDIRASDADREATAERLRVAALEGRLDSDELEARLSAAYGARWCSELERLTTDVTPPAAPPAPPPTFVRPAKRVNGYAVASAVLAVFWLGWIGSALAIVFGHVALSQIHRSRGTQWGRGLAIGGLVLGYFAVSILFLGMLIAIVAE
jgi:Domain of unknown function (DUF1707)/Domain of unknown function (DUF4190)